MSALQVGEWGGNDIQLDIRDNGGGLFTFDCGAGGTTYPIAPDDNGHFDAAGTYTSLPDPNNPTAKRPAPNVVIYHGDVSGDTISISVEFPNNDAPIGAPLDGFSVTRGAPSMVNDCGN
jgi:hypothetical protein